MAKPPQQDARRAALATLNAVESGAHADRALNRALLGVADPRDRGLATEIAYGVLRWRSQLDFEIVPRLKGRTNPALLNILRLGLYQLRFLERVPTYAAVNSAVDLAKKEGFAFAANMVNAVLRGIERAGAPVWPAGDEVESLALRFAHPEWLVKAWIAQFGFDGACALMAADQVPAPLTLRIRRGSVAEAAAVLRERGIEAAPGRFAPGALRLSGGNPQEWPEIQCGDWVVQDEAAQAMAGLLPPAERHLDLCAAPGGKAFFLADRDPGAPVHAVEAEPSRADDLRGLATKLGLAPRVTLEVADARGEVAGGALFPSVLVDAPCSGLGTLRRNPDRKWKPAPPRELPRLQQAILHQAARQTAPGGHLLYITCTLWKAENEDVVAAFEKGHPGFARVTREHPFAGPDRLYRSRPDLHGTDGFFAALWKKV